MWLTVAVVAGVDAAFKSLHLRKLGQHLGEGAAPLVSCSTWAFVYAVVSLRKLQRQIPEWLNCVRLVLAGQTRHLKKNKKNKKERTHSEKRNGLVVMFVKCNHYINKCRSNTMSCDENCSDRERKNMIRHIAVKQINCNHNASSRGCRILKACSEWY